MAEIWRDIEGFEGIYQVSNIGRVKSLNYNHTGKEKILKLSDNGWGYLTCHLEYKGVNKHFSAHRLVAEAFLPNPNNLPQVNHKDEDKTNNMVWVNEDSSIDYDKSNLEWCTSEYNINYGTRTKKANKSKNKKIIQMDEDNNIIKVWDSLKQVKEELGIGHSSLWACCNGKCKTAGGFKWQYLNGYLSF